jgi:hypothetical protein
MRPKYHFVTDSVSAVSGCSDSMFYHFWRCEGSIATPSFTRLFSKLSNNRFPLSHPTRPIRASSTSSQSWSPIYHPQVYGQSKTLGFYLPLHPQRSSNKLALTSTFPPRPHQIDLSPQTRTYIHSNPPLPLPNSLEPLTSPLPLPIPPTRK